MPTLTFKNPDNKNEDWELHEDNTINSHNKSDGTSYKREPLDAYGSYKEHHTGPKMGDDYDESYGDNSHFININDSQGGVESINSEEAFGQRLHQLKQQGQFPITLGVDSNHAPITEADQEAPGFGNHVVTVDGYDEKSGIVHISNQWGKKSNKWVNLSDLYKNASGETASSRDGADTDY
jgi:hypothetical protein